MDSIVVDKRSGFDRRNTIMAGFGYNRRTTAQDRRVNNTVPVISATALSSFIDTAKFEIELLVEFFKDQERKKLNVINSSIGTFTVFIAGIVALFLGFEGEAPTKHINIILPVVLVGLGCINLVLIKYMISLRAGTVLSMRQLNCLRQALDSAIYAQIEGQFPTSTKPLTKEGTSYNFIFGRHRKLPIDNGYLRQDCQRIFKPADNFAIYMISFFTFVFVGAGITYYANKSSVSLVIVNGGLLLTFAASAYMLDRYGRRDILKKLSD